MSAIASSDAGVLSHYQPEQNYDNSLLYGPPAPQSNSRNYDRMKSLEAAILLRRNEIEGLRQRREELMVMANTRSHNTAGIVAVANNKNSTNTNNNKKQKGSSANGADGEADRDDPTNIPIVKLCTASDGSFSMFTIPPERFGDTCVEMEVAEDSLARHTHLNTRIISELEVSNHAYEKDQARLAEQIRLMCELTGMPIGMASMSTNTANMMTKGHLKRNLEDAKTSMAPGYKMLRGLMEGDGGSMVNASSSSLSPADSFSNTACSPSELKQRNDALRKYILTLSKETREAKAIQQKKDKAIKELQQQVAAKRAMEASTLELYNSIRVADRDVKERKKALRALLEEHDRLDGLLDAAVVMKAASSVGVMDRDLLMIKQKITECVEDERRLQDRISKAQEYRIAMLNRRIDMLLACVRSHRLDADVEALIAATLELQRQQDLGPLELSNAKAAKGRNTPPSSATAAALSRTASIRHTANAASGVATPTNANQLTSSYGSVRTNAQGKPIINNGQIVIASASHKQAAQEISNLRREELYDIDTIIPPNESIHPAIYSIFVSEKEQLSRKAVTTKLIAEEKMAAVEALAAKAGTLEVKRVTVDSKLHRSEKGIKVVESQKKLDLLEEVTTNRSLLQDAMHQHVKLTRLMKEKVPIAEKARQELERRNLRRATASAGYSTGSNTFGSFAAGPQGAAASSRGTTPSGTPSGQFLQPPAASRSSFAFE